MRRAAVAGTVLAGVLLAVAAAAAVPPPKLIVRPVWDAGRVVRVQIEGRQWNVSAECPDAVPLTYRIRGTTAETTIASVSLRRPATTLAYTWNVPRHARGRVVVFSIRESCVSAGGGLHVFSAWASLRIP